MDVLTGSMPPSRHPSLCGWIPARPSYQYRIISSLSPWTALLTPLETLDGSAVLADCEGPALKNADP